MEDKLLGPKLETARVVCHCDECDQPIYEDEDYYYINDSYICQGCIDDYLQKCLRTAEVDDYDV